MSSFRTPLHLAVDLSTDHEYSKKYQRMCQCSTTTESDYFQRHSTTIEFKEHKFKSCKESNKRLNKTKIINQSNIETRPVKKV